MFYYVYSICTPFYFSISLSTKQTSKRADECRGLSSRQLLCIPSFPHSAWSESSAACPRPRGGHRKGKKLAPGAFSTVERRGPQGRAHIWVVFSCKRGKWRGPKGRADALAVCGGKKIERRGPYRDKPVFVASDQKRQILALVVSP